MGKMTAELHILRKLRRTTSMPIPESAAKVIEILGSCVFPSTLHGVTFKLRHRKRGTEIFLHAPNGFSWNLSYYENIWPVSFAEARKFVHAYAAGHGQTVEEIRRPPHH